MKTAVQEFRTQLALNHILIKDSEKVSIMISLSKFDELFNQAKEMENNRAQEYAEFAIRCDRMGMKILNFEDWINP